MSLKEFAEREIALAGMCGEAWNESQIAPRIMELIEAFRAGEHSGGSAGATIAILRSTGWERARHQETHLGIDGPVARVLRTFHAQEFQQHEDMKFAWKVFLHLAQFRPLGLYGNTDPASFRPTIEFANDVTAYCDTDGTHTIYQSTRNPAVFSADSGKTWYDLDLPEWSHPPGCTPKRQIT